MRKITSQIAAAFVAGVAKSNGNTRTDGQTLFLHGHAIARRDRGSLEISWAGWSTSTTRERINGVLSAFNSGFRVCLQDRTAHSWNFKTPDKKAVPMDSMDWHKVADVTLPAPAV